MQPSFYVQPSFSRRRLALAASLTLCASIATAATATAPAAAAAPRITAAEFRHDIAFVRAMIARMHPDPAFSTDPAAMHRALDRIAQALPDTLTRDQAWRRLATVNALLADGHFFIGYPDWREQARAWLAGGGSVFPAEVEVAPDGALYLRPDPDPGLGTGGSEDEGGRARIVAVNGVDAAELVAALSPLVHGDTPRFRAYLLGQRWWLYYWKAFGAPAHYELELERGQERGQEREQAREQAREGARRTVSLPGRRTLPAILDEEARAPFDLAIGEDGRAVLTLGTFSLADPAPFLAFTRAAFACLGARGATPLVIDISRNGGGDDALWLDGLMPYIATRPYRTGSTYRGLSRARAGEAAQPMRGEIATWRQPQPHNPLRFAGNTEVRIGPGTYSSAVLFANVMRDFQFATLVGEGGAARRSQSGGVREVRLPYSGLALVLPRFILDPPAGASPGALLEAAQGPPTPGARRAAGAASSPAPAPRPRPESGRPKCAGPG